MQWYGPIIEIETESGGGELLKKDFPIRRHLKVIMVVDGDEEGESALVFPITCTELLSEEKFNCLEGRQNWDTLDTRSCGRFEVESGN
jgi:hypothetical protein